MTQTTKEKEKAAEAKADRAEAAAEAKADKAEAAEEKAAAKAAGDRRLQCTLAGAEPGLINGIRFVAVEGGLYSEPITDEHAEQAARLCRVPEFVHAVVTPETAAAIDTALQQAVAAEAAAPTAPSPALQRALAEQQEINVAVSKERDQYRDEVQRLRDQYAASDTKAMQGDLDERAKRIVDLGTDIERLQREIQRLTDVVTAKDVEIVDLRAANESLGKQLEK